MGAAAGAAELAAAELVAAPLFAAGRRPAAAAGPRLVRRHTEDLVLQRTADPTMSETSC